MDECYPEEEKREKKTEKMKNELIKYCHEIFFYLFQNI